MLSGRIRCNSEDALAKLIDNPCDDIILDVMMPVMKSLFMRKELRVEGDIYYFRRNDSVAL